MASICLVFHAHQPRVLRYYSVFDRGIHYFDAYKSRDACRRYAAESIIPVNRLLLGLIRKCDDMFRLSICVTGTSLDLFERCCPEVLDSMRALADAGVEFLAAPYHGALPLPHSPASFQEEVELHQTRIAGLFGQTPRVFCNRELVYDDDVADRLAEMGIAGAVCDGSPDVLAGRPCSRVYGGGDSRLPLLLRNERLTRDVSERFTDRGWEGWPITAPRYAEALARFDTDREVVTLIWDYATFGLDVPADAGIFEFLRYLPEKVLEHGGLSLTTCSEAIERHGPVGAYSSLRSISMAEEGFSMDPWSGNALQVYAAKRLYELEEAVRHRDEPVLLEDWRCLQDCDYVEAMRTDFRPKRRFGGYAAVPDSPYDAFINFMNVLDSVAQRAGAIVKV